MKKLLSTILAIAMLLSLVLSLFACRETPEKPENSESESVTDTEPVERVFDVELVKDGESVFKIIRPDEASADLITVTQTLHQDLMSKLGGTFIDFGSDWSMDNLDNETVRSDETVHEILVGNTNRAESKAVAQEFEGKLGYCVKYENGKIIIWGSNVDLISTAATLFLSYISGDIPSIKSDIFLSENLLTDGTLISDIVSMGYRVVYHNNLRTNTRMKAISENLASALSAYSLNKVEVTSDINAEAEYEILIGCTNRPESAALTEKLGIQDYGYKIVGKKIVIAGGSTLMTETAVNKFITDLEGGVIKELVDGTEYFWDFEPLIADSLIYNLDSFTPVWASEHTTPEWMLDFEEKCYAITTPGNRLGSLAHRSDTDNYPENTLQGIYSAILLGADAVEMDPRLTKDNVLVLMHDATLTRTTNVNEMKGKNGLPNSVNIADWTFEQLQKLRIKHNGKVTNYRIPTVYEALTLMKDRVFLHWDCKVTDKVEKNVDAFEIADAIGAKSSFIFYWKLTTMKTWLEYDPTDADFAAYVAKMTKYLNMPGHKIRSRDGAGIKEYGDNPTGWNILHDKGVGTMFTDNIYALCKYIAANCEPFTVPE